MALWRAKSFDELPALRIGGKPLRRAMRTTTYALMFGVAWGACVTGSQQTILGKMLGFDDFYFGVFQAVPFAATFFQLMGAIHAERTGVRKYMFLYVATAGRGLWIVLAIVPLILGPGRQASLLFLGIFAVMNLLAHLSSPSWQTWISDLIPRRIRGRFFANRQWIATPINVVVALVAGILLDRMSTTALPTTAQAQPHLAIMVSVLFAMGGAMGMCNSLWYLRIREIATRPLSSPVPLPRRISQLLTQACAAPVQLIRDAFGDSSFRHYALYTATIAFAASTPGQFYWLNSLDNLHYTKLGANAVILVGGALFSLLVMRLWGRLIDSWGRRPVMILCTTGAIFGPIPWFFAPPDHQIAAYGMGLLAAAIGGMMWNGIALSQANMVFSFSETAGRSRYMAAAAVFTAIGGFTGGLLGGVIAQNARLIAWLPLRFGPFQVTNYHVTFLIQLLALCLALYWLKDMKDANARPFREMARQIHLRTLGRFLPRPPRIGES
jgi:MFS family permease